VLPPADPLPELMAALGDPRSWSGGVPAAGRGLVSVRERPGRGLAVHPLAPVAVRQRVVPLDLQLDRFGPTTPAGERRFRITAVQVDGRPVETQPVTDYFAPGQFLDLTEAERLARPSFEQLPCGVELSAAALRFGGDVDAGLLTGAAARYETKVVGAAPRARRAPAVGPLPARTLAVSVQLGAAARTWADRPGGGKYRGRPRTIQARDPRYVIVHREDLRLAEQVEGNPAAGTSYTAAAQALSRHLAANPQQRGRLKIVGAHELARVA
jgi:hypothetical protein